jgi:hypothetical protein
LLLLLDSSFQRLQAIFKSVDLYNARKCTGGSNQLRSNIGWKFAISRSTNDRGGGGSCIIGVWQVQKDWSGLCLLRWSCFVGQFGSEVKVYSVA